MIQNIWDLVYETNYIWDYPDHFASLINEIKNHDKLYLIYEWRAARGLSPNESRHNKNWILCDCISRYKITKEFEFLIQYRWSEAELGRDQFIRYQDGEFEIMGADDNRIDDVALYCDIFTKHQVEIRSLKDEAILLRKQRYEKALGMLRAMCHSCDSTLNDRYEHASDIERQNFTIMARKYKVRSSPFDKPRKEKKVAKPTSIEDIRAQLAALEKQKRELNKEDED